MGALLQFPFVRRRSAPEPVRINIEEELAPPASLYRMRRLEERLLNASALIGAGRADEAQAEIDAAAVLATGLRLIAQEAAHG